jgi:FMN phosphatase YigB (HAD superfamily)
LIKAVFFDWFNTLALYDPPREELQRQAFLEFGVDLPAAKIAKGIIAADKYYFSENLISRVDKRSSEEQARIYSRYEEVILTEAGAKFENDLPGRVYRESRNLYGRRKIGFVLFPDVLPVLRKLDSCGIILGILSNFDKGMMRVTSSLGLDGIIDVVVTPEDAGVDKPDPKIFRVALDKAKVKPEETAFVGDQPKVDAAGAKAVGMTAVLIDRFNMYPEVQEYPRIKSLDELDGILLRS